MDILGSILGSLLAIVTALAFVALAGLLAWGGRETLRGEIQRGFTSAPPAPIDRVLTVLGLTLPLAGAALLSLLAGGRILLVALHLGQG